MSPGLIMKPNKVVGIDCFVDADYAGMLGYVDSQDQVSVKSQADYALLLFWLSCHLDQ